MVDREKRLSQLDNETTTTTARLLEEQRLKLAIEAEKAKQLLTRYKERTTEEREAAEVAHEELIHTQTRLDKLTDIIKTLEKQIDVLTIDNEALSQRHTKLQQQITTENSRLGRLIEQNDTLNATKSQVELDISGLEALKERLDNAINQLEAKQDELATKNETIEVEIDNKIAVKRIQLEELVKYETETRKDLANRSLALDEREKIVAVRERKADMQEQVIEQNANLLEL